MPNEIEEKAIRRITQNDDFKCDAQTGSVASINISDGGVPKQPVAEALITESGLEGDRQRDLRYHGGPDRAVVIYSLELIRALKCEGHPIKIGSAGENLTISGLDWRTIAPGVELRAGSAELVLTKYATPCYIIGASFLNGEIERISQKLHPGWSRVCARVLRPGMVYLGDPVQVISNSSWSHENAQEL